MLRSYRRLGRVRPRREVTLIADAKSPHSKRLGFPFYNGLAGFGVAGFVFLDGLEKRRLLRLRALAGVLAGALRLSSCGGSAANRKAANSSTNTPAGIYSVVVNASSGASRAATTVMVTIR